jgi:hypothetical protein
MKYFKEIIFTFVFVIIGINSVNATGNYTISLSSNSVTNGKSVKLYIKGNDILGGFSVSSSNSTICTVSESRAWVENNTYTISVSAINTGSCTINVSPISISDSNANDISLPSKSVSLTVTNGSSSSNNNSNSGNKNNTNTEVKKSNDATLKALSIEGISITPEFKSDVLEYKAEAEAGVEKVKINATTNDSKSTVSGTGEVSVSDGINKLEVTVVAEDNTTKTYIINLTVKEYDPIKAKIGKKEYTVVRKENDLPDVDLFEKSKVEIGDNEVVGYYNDKLNIYLIGLKDDKGNISLYVYDTKKNSYVEYKWITIGGVTLWLKDSELNLDKFKKYVININNFNVDIYKIKKKDNVGLLYGTNVVTGNTGYYVYDKDEETLARYYDKEVDIYKNEIDNYKKCGIILVGILSGIVIIIIVISLVRCNKKTRKIKG